MTSVCTCGAPRMWVCTTCETLNPYSVGICSICGAAKPAAPPPQQQPANWGKGFGGDMVSQTAAMPAPAQAPVSAKAPAAAPPPVPFSPPAAAASAAPVAAAPRTSVSAGFTASSDERSASAEAARKKRKRIRTGLIIANVALLAANVVGIILILR